MTAISLMESLEIGTKIVQPPCPANRQFQFGPVRLPGSVSTSSTRPCGNSLILFDFSKHRSHHRHHSDPKVTMRYSHLSSKSMQEAANSASLAIQRGMPVAVTNDPAAVAA